MRPHNRSPKGISPMGFARNAISVAKRPGDLGSRSQAASSSTARAAGGWPRSSSGRGWDPPQPKAVFLGKALAAAITSTPVMAG
eukprot:3316987-Pyramimonas_sp.AAC.1